MRALRRLLAEAARQLDRLATSEVTGPRGGLLEQALAGLPPHPEVAAARAEVEGWEASPAYVVALLACDRLPAADADRLVALVRDALELPTGMVARHGGCAVAALPAHEAERRLGAMASRVPHEWAPWRAALGRAEPGLAGLSASHRQALEAHDAAEAMGLRGLVAYDELLPVLLLCRSPDLARDLVESTVAPLQRHDTERGADLVRTLEALFDEQGNAVAAAKALSVHRHTMAARLKRIEELSGRSLRDRGDLLLLGLGLLARRLPPAS